MRAKEFMSKAKDWMEKRKIPPLPPKQNLFHATWKEFADSIMKTGLSPNPENRIYPTSESGVVYMTTSPRKAVEMLAPDSDMINKVLLKKLGNTGVVFEIDVSQLDPEKFRPDELLPTNPIFRAPNTYKYEGHVPASALKLRSKIYIDDPYYNQKQVQNIMPSKFKEGL